VGGGEDHGVPEGELPAGLEVEAVFEEGKGVGDDGPRGEVIDETGSGFGGLAGADEIDKKLLEDLHADGGPSGRNKGLADDGCGLFTLFSGVEVVGVEEDVGIEELLSGHGSPLG
jgi:hypothetical protein